MKRLGRILFNAITLILAVLTVWLSWLVRGHAFYSSDWGFHFGDRTHPFFIVGGAKLYFGVLGKSWHSIEPVFPIALAALLPGIRLGILYVRWNRQYNLKRNARIAAQRGVCRICGYDLRATPERCPECGTPATSVSPSHCASGAAGKS